MNTNMISYYGQRAGEYETIYTQPERRSDLQKLAGILQKIFKGKKLLEIACGTGYWTEKISWTADSIYASDINTSVLEIAAAKKYYPAKVEFRIADLYKIAHDKKEQSLFAGFIWSHIKLQDLPAFIETVNALVEKGGTIVFVDNRYVEGSSLPISGIDEEGNSYQLRELEDGTIHKIVKNFPSPSFIKDTLGNNSSVKITELEFYWILEYQNI